MFYNDTTGRYESLRKKDWHRWFAWKPVSINDNVVWFKFLYRRGYRHDLRTHLISREPALSKWHWEYAENLFELMAKSDDEFPVPDETLTTYSVRRPPPPPPKVPPPPPRILKF
jgi:hypothetical protein